MKRRTGWLIVSALFVSAGMVAMSVGGQAHERWGGGHDGPGYHHGHGMMMHEDGRHHRRSWRHRRPVVHYHYHFYNMGPGMMGSGMGYGMRPGMMMGPGMMAPGQDGDGDEDGGARGPGMMGPGMGQGMGPGMGHGMGQGMGQGMGPGMMGPGTGMHRGQPRDISVDDVRAMLERHLAWQNNPNLKVGKVEEKNDDIIVGEIVTKDESLVDRLEVDRRTGRIQRAK